MDRPGFSALSEDGRVRLLASKRNWIEGEAVSQLKKTAELPGVRLAVGLPDLHPGRGHPVGAAFITEGVFYPQLVGNDVGCGMALWQTDLKRQKFKLDRAVKRFEGLESPWEGDTDVVIADMVEAGLIRVVATLKPRITYKVRRS